MSRFTCQHDEMLQKIDICALKDTPGVPLPSDYIRLGERVMLGSNECNWAAVPIGPKEYPYPEILARAIATVQDIYDLPSRRLGSTTSLSAK